MLHLTKEKKLAVLQDIMAGQMNRKELAKANQVSLSSVDRCRSIYKNRPKGISLAELAGMKTYGTGKSEKVTSKADKLNESIRNLHANGMTIKEIARQLKVSTGTANYHLYMRPSRTAPKVIASAPHSKNGGQPHGVNKYVSLGIAYAETERFIAHLGERLALPSAFLRSRLSELLGRETLRGARRDED